VKTVTTPYNVTLANGVNLPSSSIAQTVHTFPLSLHFIDASGSRIDYELLNRRDPNVEALMPEPPVENPTDIDNALDIFTTYWYIVILIIGGIGLGLFLVILRRTNAVDFSELEDVSDGLEEDDEWEQMVEDVAAWDEVLESETTKKKPTPPDAVKRDLRRQPKPPSAVRKDLKNSRQQDEHNDSPRQKTKKTIQSNIGNENEVDFGQLISNEDPSTNISEDKDDEIMEDALSFITSKPEEKDKRRRPVRRKKSSD
jgi:hypothetical protein